ncbi:MAG: hypothetical protein OIF34_05175 [Porticoccaceae bacterium]|nr:hypothetical protein [Porticoccaceae bacterium]
MIELRILTGSCVLELKYAAEKLLVREGEVIQLMVADELQVAPVVDRTDVPGGKEICRHWRNRVKLLLSMQKY